MNRFGRWKIMTYQIQSYNNNFIFYNHIYTPIEIKKNIHFVFREPKNPSVSPSLERQF